MKTLKRAFATVTIVLTVILIHLGLMYRIRKDLNSIEYDFDLVF